MKKFLLGILTLVSNVGFSQIQTGYFYSNTPGSFKQVVSSYNWDMNKDGTNDFVFSLDYDTLIGNVAHVTPQSGSQIEIAAGNDVRNIADGNAVGTGTWSSSAGVISYGPAANPQLGSFGDATSAGYLGVKVTAGSNIYIGWVKITQFDGATRLFTFAYNKVSGQGINAGQTNPTGVSDITSENFKVYLANRILKVETLVAPTEKTEMIVSNLSGQILLRNEIAGGINEFSLTDFANGMYVVTILNNQKRLVARIISNE